VDVVSAILTANGSLSIWFKPDWNSGDSIINGIAGATTDGDNFFRIEHFLDNNWYAGWVTGNIDHRAVISSATMSVISGSWYHLAVVWDDTTNVTMVYLNGVSKGQNTSLVTNSIIQPLRIGSYDATTDGFFNGLIDDVRIYNRALSADEIKRLYRIGGTLHVNTTINNDTLQKGLVGYWSFDGQDMTATHAMDISGQGNNGTLTNGPVKVKGKLGQGLSFDGSDDYVGITGKILIDLISGSTGSITAWIKPTGVAPTVTTADTGDAIFADAAAGMGLFRAIIGGNDRIWAYNWDGNEDRVGGTYVNDAWNFVGWTHANGTLYITINGVIVSSIPSGNTTDLSTQPRIGLGYAGFNGYFTGLIDDVRVYNRALSAAEIQRLYNLGR